jgi:hypothetical protein
LGSALSPFDVLSNHYVVERGPIDVIRLESVDRLGITAIPDSDGDVAAQTGNLGARHWATLCHSPQLGIGTTPQFDQTRKVESAARLPRVR